MNPCTNLTCQHNSAGQCDVDRCILNSHIFSYSYEIPLKSGKKFKRSGKIRAYSQRDAVQQIKDCCPEALNIVAKPFLNGNLIGTDKAFQNLYDL